MDQHIGYFIPAESPLMLLPTDPVLAHWKLGLGRNGSYYVVIENLVPELLHGGWEWGSWVSSIVFLFMSYHFLRKTVPK